MNRYSLKITIEGREVALTMVDLRDDQAAHQLEVGLNQSHMIRAHLQRMHEPCRCADPMVTMCPIHGCKIKEPEDADAGQDSVEGDSVSGGC